MRVVFLDVDGVINNFGLIRLNGFNYIDPVMVSRVRMVVEGSDSKIVLSSTWRIKEGDRALVAAALGEQGMFIHDVTPCLGTYRSQEISDWLRGNPEVEKYAILDDDEDAGFGMEDSFFRTDPEVGLTDRMAEIVLLHLRGEDA
jgi:hypothetical protein